MEILDGPLAQQNVHDRLTHLVERHHRAGGFGIELLNMIGSQAEGLLDRLPENVKDGLERRTFEALQMAMRAAHGSRQVVEEQPSWMSQAMTTAMGAVGGFGGLPTALAELPVTTAVLLRAIQDVAVEHGFDPEEPGVQFDCIQVFAAAGPMDHDDGADLTFLTIRTTLTGATLQALIAKVAPRLATVMGQKLAAQTVPILGAAAGAATNYTYSRYYQQMAHVHFGLRRLAIEADIPHADIVSEFKALAALPDVDTV